MDLQVWAELADCALRRFTPRKDAVVSLQDFICRIQSAIPQKENLTIQSRQLKS
ncbi:hypothetical protein [Helicobacter rodentium]|uniref:hypothetical protein n=1 Tax=Helicobacter rodentium TaxID=59617 RepID=UPI0025A4DD78|nr:hypothetical protein [Helicobacter rodentium]